MKQKKYAPPPNRAFKRFNKPFGEGAWQKHFAFVKHQSLPVHKKTKKTGLLRLFFRLEAQVLLSANGGRKSDPTPPQGET